MDFIANKYITDTYLDKRMREGDSIVYVTSCGGLKWEKWRREYRKVMDCRTWDEMVAFMKGVCPKNGVGAMAYTLAKRALNYYTALKAELEKMAGGEEALKKENGAVGRLATPQEMAEPIVFLNSDMARFVSGLMFIADWGHNCEKVLGFTKNQLDVPAALKLYNTKKYQKILSGDR